MVPPGAVWCVIAWARALGPDPDKGRAGEIGREYLEREPGAGRHALLDDADPPLPLDHGGQRRDQRREEATRRQVPVERDVRLVLGRDVEPDHADLDPLGGAGRLDRRGPVLEGGDASDELPTIGEVEELEGAAKHHRAPASPTPPSGCARRRPPAARAPDGWVGRGSRLHGTPSTLPGSPQPPAARAYE